ncbi:MAG: two pore domain potassium channel family protein [Ruminococcaceae bacterium]|nr:two pore domain potassium channel family protein [Oscillospiraceae bacterium]
MRKKHSHLVRALIFFFSLIFIGVIGYSVMLQISFIDAVYMTIITISTVGYKEVAEMNAAAKLLSIFIIFGGIALVGYTLTNFVEFLAGGHVQDAWRRRRMEKRFSIQVPMNLSN